MYVFAKVNNIRVLFCVLPVIYQYDPCSVSAKNGSSEHIQIGEQRLLIS